MCPVQTVTHVSGRSSNTYRHLQSGRPLAVAGTVAGQTIFGPPCRTFKLLALCLRAEPPTRTSARSPEQKLPFVESRECFLGLTYGVQLLCYQFATFGYSPSHSVTAP